MTINKSELWISDIDEIIASLPDLDALCGKRVMITGCTGLICSAVIDILIHWNETHDSKVIILAAGRNIRKIEERFKSFSERDWFVIVPYDASATNNKLILPCDYIIHGASNASPNSIVKEPVETMMSNFVGIKCLLDYARVQAVKRVLYISSSEVYGKKEDNMPFKSGEYGYIDLLNPRNSYSIGKRAAETLCISYAAEYGVDSVIVRPGHIYGPTAVESDNRVSSSWAYSVAQGESIIMKSDGSQIRSYCYCLDCASAILKVLISGNTMKAYNVSNPDSIISIKELATILAESAGVELKMEVPTDDEKRGFNPMNNSSLDSSDLESLGWHGLFDAKRGLSHTVSILKEIRAGS